MSERTPPGRDSDPFSAFLSDAQRNERITSLKMPDVHALLQRAQGGFLRVQEITEADNNATLFPTRSLTSIHAAGSAGSAGGGARQ